MIAPVKKNVENKYSKSVAARGYSQEIKEELQIVTPKFNK